jgi:hypothetical protein
VRTCSGQAISADETEKITVAGHEIEFAKLDYLKCSTAYMGGTIEYNPFLTREANLDEMPQTYHGVPKLSSWTGYGSHMGHNPALEGARGCMRECYIHLEETGRLKRKFVNNFRTHKPWMITPEHREAWLERAMGECSGTKESDE